MSDWESDLLVGVAQYLNDSGVANYKPSYTSTDTAIVFGDPPPSPDRAVGLTLYSASDSITQNLSSVRLQLLLRGAPNNSLDVGSLATAAFNALQGLANRDFGTAHLVQMYRVSAVPLGLDDLRRSTRADNYQIDVNTPYSVGRTP